MGIPSNVIETIKSNTNIVDIIGEYVSLTREGQGYKGICPFHNDHSPSLIVNPTKGIYKCFACGASGDVIGFLEKYLSISFPEAVEILAKKHGIEIPKYNLIPQNEELQKKRDSMYIVNDFAQQYFLGNIFNGSVESNFALKYATSRWPLEYIKSCGIGYASNVWQNFHEYALSKGLSKDILLELGLLTKHPTKGNFYDTYRGRVMIPIRDKQKRIIGFTARIVPGIIESGQQQPKYINSPTSLIFEKSSALFGIEQAMREAGKAGEMNLVEGAPDVMRLQIIGAPNSVASLGTSLTEKQFELIKRATTKINIIPDSDEVKDGSRFGIGFKSAIRTGKMAMSLGFLVTIQEIPTSESKNDPDSYLTSLTIKDSLQKKDFVLWYAEKLLTSANDSVVNRAKAIHDIVDVIKSSKDNILMETYVDKFATIYGHQKMWHRELLGTYPQVLVPCEKMPHEEYVSLFKGSDYHQGIRTGCRQESHCIENREYLP